MYEYKKEYRLNKADDFSSVFNFRKVRNGGFIKIHYKPTDNEYSRLGIIVSKKNHKRANKRNYMKRFIREYFRLNHLSWNSVDIIIRVNKFFTADDYNKVILEMNFLTSKFIKKI